jgi:RNA polymerase sigma factor (TIGR02999 family)
MPSDLVEWSSGLMNSEDPRFVYCLQDPDEDLMKVLYQELKILARSRMASERAGHTLGPTALVHEAWLRLEKSSPEAWRDRSQFFAAASEAMRRILVESARKRLAVKRGAGAEAVPLEDLQISGEVEDEKILAVHEALDDLAKQDPLKAQIVKLRFFSGMEHQEIATLLQVNEKTVRRHWAVAKVMLYETINGLE